MATKTLLLDEFELIDFQLYGILSSISDSPQFVCLFNQFFQTKFQRTDDLDVWIESQISYYPIFEWEDVPNGVGYHIIKNSAYSLESEENSGNLFSLFEIAPALINQYKHYTYLLKVSGAEYEELPFYENNFIQVITELDTSTIKTIDRLIF